MRIFTAKEKIRIYYNNYLLPNKRYILAEGVAKKLLENRSSCLSIGRTLREEFSEKIFNINNVKENDNVLLIRHGGIGDILFLFPIFKYLKDILKVNVYVATSPMYKSLIYLNEDISRVMDIPLLVDELHLNSIDWILSFENTIESNNPKAKLLHAVDYFFDEIGVDYRNYSGSKVAELKILGVENQKAKKQLSDLNIPLIKKKVAIQIQSSSPTRNFPIDKMIDIIRELLKDKDVYILLFGGNRQKNFAKIIMDSLNNDRVFDFIEEDKTLREAIAITNLMDLVIAPDSSFVHIAGALGVPVIGLYGPFPSFIRMRYYKRAVGLDTNVSCAPCFRHGHSSCPLGYPSPCFSVFSFKKIAELALSILNGTVFDLSFQKYNIFEDSTLVKSSFIDLDGDS
jgi:hypothetical protein